MVRGVYVYVYERKQCFLVVMVGVASDARRSLEENELSNRCKPAFNGVE